jgi:ABC-type bacteriocin/lantibiotic exporter with double-glycine peptidase domain
LAVAYELLGARIENHALSELAGESGATSLLALRDAARHNGLHAEAVSSNPTQLAALNTVAILHLQLPAGAGERRTDHFVVFAGLGDNGGIHAVDPTSTTALSGSVDPEALFEHWSGKALLLSLQPLPIDSSASRHSWSDAFWWVLLPCACLCLPLLGSMLLRRLRRL